MLVKTTFQPSKLHLTPQLFPPQSLPVPTFDHLLKASDKSSDAYP